jgi:threonyl-tRNA synthetase
MVNDEVAPYANEVASEMRKHGIRVEVNGGASIPKLVRNATKSKTPVVCVVGKQEVEARTLSVRLMGGEELGAVPLDTVLSGLVKANSTKSEFRI